MGYRSWTLREAKKWQLTGWVKNREDGAVELVAEGPQSDLETFVQSYQHGPEVAWVEHADISWETATNEFAAFEVLY